MIMELSSSIKPNNANRESPSAPILLNKSSETPEGLIGSPLTPTTNVDLSTPHEPCCRRSLVECFEHMMTLEESEEPDCYDSDGNGPPPVVLDEFEYSEKSLDDTNAPNATGPISVPSNFIFLEESVIDGFKVDELRKELEKRSLSKARLKAELKERLEKAMVDRVPVIDAEKFAPGPDNFDKGSRWIILEPSVTVLEPKCQDQSLVDPSTSKYSEGKKLSTENKVIKMDYEHKFKRAKFEIEALQPSKSLCHVNESKKRKSMKPFVSRNIHYIKKQ